MLVVAWAPNVTVPTCMVAPVIPMAKALASGSDCTTGTAGRTSANISLPMMWASEVTPCSSRVALPFLPFFSRCQTDASAG